MSAEEPDEPHSPQGEGPEPALKLSFSYAGLVVSYGCPSRDEDEEAATGAACSLLNTQFGPVKQLDIHDEDGIMPGQTFYTHAGYPYTMTRAQKQLPHGTEVSVAHGPIDAGDNRVWEGPEATFTAEVLYHCDSGLTCIKTIDPRRHTHRHRGYTETVETSRLRRREKGNE